MTAHVHINPEDKMQSYQTSLALQWPPPHVVTATVMITESKEATLVSYCSSYSFHSPIGPHGLELFYMPSSSLRIFLLSMFHLVPLGCSCRG